MHSKNIVCLDVGEKRIGVAVADTAIRIAIPLETVEVDGQELAALEKIIIGEGADLVVIGYPRNQSGEATAQTHFVEEFSYKLKDIAKEIVFQDESLTSVLAEDRLKSYKKPYKKGDIDALAAAIILQDYLEENHDERH